MKFSEAQLEQYRTHGYVIVDCPFPERLTEECMAAVEKAAQDPTEGPADGSKRNHFYLRPQLADSYWCFLDHSLPFMQIILHPEIIELGRQLAGDSDIYMRNGGINEQAPNRSVGWHIDGGPGWAEFMHYFSGASRENGCLRIVPGSHNGPPSALEKNGCHAQGGTGDSRFAGR